VAPEFTVAAPVRELLPERVTVPLPLAVMAPEPDRSPLKVTLPPLTEVKKVS
jgi:hypothetical protein